MKKFLKKIAAVFEKVVEWFETRNDKVQHLIVCFAGSFVFGYGFGIGAGFAAEYKDHVWGGRWSWGDIVADIVGMVAGSALRFYVFGRF